MATESSQVVPVTGRRTAVLGMGHVGSATAAWLLHRGHAVLAVEPDPIRRGLLARGLAPVVEPGLGEILAAGHAAGRLEVVAALLPEHLARLEVVLVCVGTPGLPGGALDLGQLERAAREIGRGLAACPAMAGPCLVVCRSTVPPGTMRDLVLPILTAASGPPGGVWPGPVWPGPVWDVAFWPEFLREGSAMADMLAPSRLVLGERSPGVTSRLGGLLDQMPVPLLTTDLETAELAKLADNAWHATKVAFANELSRLAGAVGVEARQVAELFLADHRLNLGRAYLLPGPPYGGSCLPKDLAALDHLGREHGLTLPVMTGVAASNHAHLLHMVELVRSRVPPPGPILQIGLSFKPATDDLRGSPLLALADRLTAEGYELWIVDPDLPLERDPRLRASSGALPGIPRLILQLKSCPDPWHHLAADLPRLDLRLSVA